MRIIEISRIKNIRDKECRYLSDPKKLELEFLPSLGLNNERLHEFPEELYEFCGTGLFHWQYPNQFSKFLVLISKLQIKSYLEIGVRWGGTFILVAEYLNKFHPLKRAIGIDINDCPSITLYKRWNSKVEFMNMDSKSVEFKEFIKKSDFFDLVFIDGDHSEDGCKNDFETVKPKANIIVFHDIVSDVVPGVENVWKYVKKNFAHEYTFIEYTNQYESVRRRTGKRFLGIGIAIKKDISMNVYEKIIQELKANIILMKMYNNLIKNRFPYFIDSLKKIIKLMQFKFIK
jgi:cephalosporin hydroxylase